MVLNRTARDRYKWGNKPSKHLAKILQKKKNINYIEKIQTKDGNMVYSPKGIAEIFRTYYQELYSVQQQEVRPGDKNRKIINFLRNAGLPKIAK